MKKQSVHFLIIFLAITFLYPLPILASEYSELHCPTIIKVEDSLGNVYNGSGIQGSFIKGSVNTITVKITATDPQGLPLHYQFLFGGWMKVDGTEMTNWVTENTTTLDVSNANAGANQSNWIRVDNQDGYGCIGAYYDTQAHFMYDVYPPETSCLSFTYSNWGTCSDSGQQSRSIISSSPSGCIGGTPILSQSCTPAPKTCTSFIYSDWSSCSSEGQQTRSTNSSSPSGCTGGGPVLTQSCTYVPAVCASWTYSNWSACSNNGQQTRSINSSSPTGCAGGIPVLTGSCTYVAPTCTSWVYSAWNTCANSQQTRNIESSQPTSCTGGNPILNQSCDSTPSCTENNWTSVLTPTNCPSNGQQVKKWTKIGQCQNGTSHSSEESISCNYQAPTCTEFTYGDWGTCNASGVQSRSTLSSSPSTCVGGNPVLSQSCKYNSSEVPNKVSVEETKNNPPVSVNNNQNSQNDSILIKNNEQEVNQEKTVTNLQATEQRKSDVASAVQKIIQIAGKDSKVGEQVKTITETQAQSQEKLETSLQKVQSRGGLAKFFVGPDYGEINNTKKLLEQNREQIKQLDEVQNQLTDKNDKQKLIEQIQLLEQTNQEIENSLDISQKGFSLFGWIFRLFTK